jgi:hypothetical protein
MRIEGTTFTDDNHAFNEAVKHHQEQLHGFVVRTSEITQKDLAKNHSEDLLLRHTVEELGEYAAAKTVEQGIKNKTLKEDSKTEAVDLIICALSLFFANKGTVDELYRIGFEKLSKWEKRV